ncbi:hypothetical protein DFH09DRAFT_1085548 [Mycena vulgaris]|nr:hypothetical protein DFH09DRAFT_1085548 [Mycena vulgaris]
MTAVPNLIKKTCSHKPLDAYAVLATQKYPPVVIETNSLIQFHGDKHTGENATPDFAFGQRVAGTSRFSIILESGFSQPSEDLERKARMHSMQPDVAAVSCLKLSTTAFRNPASSRASVPPASPVSLDEKSVIPSLPPAVVQNPPQRWQRDLTIRESHLRMEIRIRTAAIREPSAADESAEIRLDTDTVTYTYGFTGTYPDGSRSQTRQGAENTRFLRGFKNIYLLADSGEIPIEATTIPNGTRHRVPATPRKHKTPAPDRLLGVKPLKETLQEIKNKTRERLKLNFDVDDWQGELIRRLRQGYDSLMIAGTGYGKSIIFEALAALNKSKVDGVRDGILREDLLEPLDRRNGYASSRVAEGAQSAGTRPANLKEKAQDHGEKKPPISPTNSPLSSLLPSGVSSHSSASTDVVCFTLVLFRARFLRYSFGEVIYPRQYAGIEDGPDVVQSAALQLYLETSVVDDLVALLECNFLHTRLDDCGVQLGDAFGKAVVPGSEWASRSEAQGRGVAHKDSGSLFDHWDRRFEEEKEEVPDGESEESEQRKHELALDLRCLEVPGGEKQDSSRVPR